MKTVEMDKVLAEVGGAINYYGLRVSRKCGMEFADARQELTIAAWQSAVRYQPKKSGCECRKWIISDIYFKSKKLIDRQHERRRSEARVMPLIFPLIPTMTADHANTIINKIEKEERVSNLHPILREMVRLSRQGLNQKEIAERMDRSQQWVGYKIKELLK